MRSIQELMNLSGKTALITGGAGHIGKAVADALAEAGCSIAIADIDARSAEEVAMALKEKFQIKTAGYDVDLAEESQVRELPEKAVTDFGSLDILVNCAAFVGTSDLEGWVTPFKEQRTEAWRAAFEVNLTACFALIQSATPFLERTGHGSIINIASMYGCTGPDWRLYDDTQMGNPAAYAASKGGLIQLTTWLATTLAPNIRVNAISPGGIWRNQPQRFVERYEKKTPLGRMGIEEDMKGAALYFASDLSAYVTGQNLLVDGGWTAW